MIRSPLTRQGCRHQIPGAQVVSSHQNDSCLFCFILLHTYMGGNIDLHGDDGASCNADSDINSLVYSQSPTGTSKLQVYISLLKITKIVWQSKGNCPPSHKEYVAVSIDICPWQNPMRLGIKLKVTPCDTPGCIQYVNWVLQSSITRSFTDAQFA